MACLYLVAVVLLVCFHTSLSHPINLQNDLWTWIVEHQNSATSPLHIEKLVTAHSYESVLTLSYDMPIPDPLQGCPDFFSDLLTPQICSSSPMTQLYCDRMSEYRELLKRYKSALEVKYSFEDGSSLDQIDTVEVGMDSRRISRHLMEDQRKGDRQVKQITVGTFRSATLAEWGNNVVDEQNEFQERVTEDVQDALDSIDRIGEEIDEFIISAMAADIFRQCKRHALYTDKWIVDTQYFCSSKQQDIHLPSSSSDKFRDSMIKSSFIRELISEFKPLLEDNGFKLAISPNTIVKFHEQQATECHVGKSKIHVIIKAPVQRKSVSWELFKISNVPFLKGENICAYESVEDLIVGKQKSSPKMALISNRDLEECSGGKGALCLIRPNNFKINDKCLLSLLENGMPSSHCNLTCDNDEDELFYDYYESEER